MERDGWRDGQTDNGDFIGPSVGLGSNKFMDKTDKTVNYLDKYK